MAVSLQVNVTGARSRAAAQVIWRLFDILSNADMMVDR